MEFLTAIEFRFEAVVLTENEGPLAVRTVTPRKTSIKK